MGNSLVLYQISWLVTLVFFLMMCWFAVKIFFAIKVKRLGIAAEVLLCFVIFCFLLAFYINF